MISEQRSAAVEFLGAQLEQNSSVSQVGGLVDAAEVATGGSSVHEYGRQNASP